MFARIVSFQLKSDRLDEAAKFYKENIIPAAKSQKGFDSSYFLIDRKTGKSISVAFWGSEEDIVASEESGWAQEQVDKFKDYSTGSVTRGIYEVSAQS